MKILTACGGVGQSRHGGVEVVELILGQGQSGLLDVHQLLLVGEILLGGDQVAAEHVLLQCPPLPGTILSLSSGNTKCFSKLGLGNLFIHVVV